MFKRQGDILFEKVDSVNEAAIGRYRSSDGVIAKGETTGHTHKLVGGELGDGVIFAPEGAKVVHEEHDTVELEPGVWLIHRQIEYVGKGETQAVWD